MRKRSKQTEFACFVRNETPRAIALSVPLGRVEREPRMDAKAYAALRDRIRRQVAAPIAEIDAHISGDMTTSPSPHQEAVSFADDY
ncbi:MAG: hypothetical protein HC869_20810 [Rhodospirillales bacterium]|nr:hypothetical protein [Rhodospirillales bacterium]